MALAALDPLVRALAGAAQPARQMIVQNNASPLMAEALRRGALGDGNIETPTELVGNLAQLLSARVAENRGQKSAADMFAKSGDALTYALAGKTPTPIAPPGATMAADGSQAYSPAPMPGGGGGGNSVYRDAIAAIESRGSGDYSAVGPRTKSGDRAYGRYQVMGNNIPSWTQEALGYSMTPDQFLADQSAQDAVFDHQFGGYVKKYGNPQDAASAWFTGRPLAQGANAQDILGTSGNEYVDKFNRALASLGGQQAAPQLSMPSGTQLAYAGNPADLALPPVQRGVPPGDPSQYANPGPFAPMRGVSPEQLARPASGSAPAGMASTSPLGATDYVAKFREILGQSTPLPGAQELASAGMPQQRVAAEGGGFGTYSPTQTPGSYQDRTNGQYWTPPDFAQAPPGGVWDSRSNSWQARPGAAPDAPPVMDKDTALRTLMEAARNPWAPASDVEMYRMAIERLTAAPNYTWVSQNGSLYRDDGSGTLELAIPAAPEPMKPTDAMREFDFARQNGFAGSFEDWMTRGKEGASRPANVQEYEYYRAQEEAAGRAPLSFNEWSRQPDEMKPPDPTAEMRNYEFYRQQEAAAGREPMGFDQWVKPAEDGGGFDDEAKLRGEYIKGSGDYVTVRDAYGRLQAALADDTNAGHMATVYAFMKMLDPGSVVRESEYATAENAAGVPDTIRNLWNRILSGERLPDELRQTIQQQANQQYAAAEQRQAQYQEQYRQLSGAYGFDPARIVIDLSGGVPVPDMTDAVVPPPAAGVPNVPPAAVPNAPPPVEVWEIGPDGTPQRVQ